MEKVRNITKPKPKPNPQQPQHQSAKSEREERNVQKAIRDAAKRNDMGSAKALAKEIVRSKRTVNLIYENKAQLNSISMQLGESVAVSRTAGHLSKSAEVMKLVNNLMEAPEVVATVQEFSKEMTKDVNDSVDVALHSEGIEEEIEEEVDKVLTAVSPEAVRKAQGASREDEAFAETVDDEKKEVEAIRVRPAKVMS